MSVEVDSELYGEDDDEDEVELVEEVVGRGRGRGLAISIHQSRDGRDLSRVDVEGEVLMKNGSECDVNF